MTSLRSLFSSATLALVIAASLAPAASASRVAPPVSPSPPPASHVMFAQPPAGWAGGASADVPSAIVVTRATVRAALAEARSASLGAFATYMNNQIYPSNTYRSGKLNVWRDAEGHYCAAATILRASGRIAISEGVAASNNNLRLIDVNDGELMDWILTSGLTQQEIDRIQEPFMDVQRDTRRSPAWASDVDPAKKRAETARLQKTYRATYAALQKNEAASLDLAVNRLMAHPDLARDFLDGSLALRAQR